MQQLSELSDDDLDRLYAVPRTPWLRVNMVSTLDGAGTGEGGKTASINNAADMRVFTSLRRICDVVVVGAGTARAEGYRDIGKPLVLVTRGARVPVQLRDAPRGDVLMATCAAAEGLAEARATLGEDNVLVLGQYHVDLPRMKSELAARGLGHVLSEGGPHLLRDLLGEGVVDELDLTLVPRVIAGDHTRITSGPPVEAPLSLHLLLEDEGTLIGRWFTDRRL